MWKHVFAFSCYGPLSSGLRVTDLPVTKPAELLPSLMRPVSNVLSHYPMKSSPFLGARALLLLTELLPRPGPLPGILINAFGLTPAEARLASLVASGASLDVVAAHLGITRDTARNQLKAVFAKTNTHRQAELVALLSGTIL